MVSFILKSKSFLVKILEVMLILSVGSLVIDVVWGVFTRYVMGEQAKWTEELARFLLVWVSLLGGALAFGTKGHLGVDYFVGKLHCDARKLMTIFSHFVVLLFSISIFLYGGTYIVAESLKLEQMTPALGWEMGYVYLALPISGFFMLLFTLENLYETIVTPANQLHEPEGEEIN
jgi:TRAP-type C4-dicarboxylate transport system permease small subunit